MQPRNNEHTGDIKTCGLLLQPVTLALAIAARPDQTIMIAKAVKHFLRWNYIKLKNPNWNILPTENCILQEPFQLLEVSLAPGLLEVLAEVSGCMGGGEPPIHVQNSHEADGCMTIQTAQRRVLVLQACTPTSDH